MHTSVQKKAAIRRLFATTQLTTIGRHKLERFCDTERSLVHQVLAEYSNRIIRQVICADKVDHFQFLELEKLIEISLKLLDVSSSSSDVVLKTLPNQCLLRLFSDANKVMQRDFAVHFAKLTSPIFRQALHSGSGINTTASQLQKALLIRIATDLYGLDITPLRSTPKFTKAEILWQIHEHVYVAPKGRQIVLGEVDALPEDFFVLQDRLLAMPLALRRQVMVHLSALNPTREAVKQLVTSPAVTSLLQRPEDILTLITTTPLSRRSAAAQKL